MPTITELFTAMPQYANADAIAGVEKTIQFNVTGDEPAIYYFDISGGVIEAHEGTAEAADVTITTPSDVWLDIATGKLNGAVAYMTGKFKAQGDLSILMSMQNWFDIPSQ